MDPSWFYEGFGDNCGKAGRELYDHANDPDEVHNLANLDKFAYTVKRLSKQLRPFAGKAIK